MIEFADAVTTEAVTQSGPSMLLVAVLGYLARGIPALTQRTAKVMDVSIAFVTNATDTLALFKRWLRAQLNEPDPKESGEQTVVKLLADDPTDEQLLAALDAIDPTDSIPPRLLAKGEQLRRVTKLYRRRREASGPRRAAQ